MINAKRIASCILTAAMVVAAPARGRLAAKNATVARIIAKTNLLEGFNGAMSYGPFRCLVF